MLLPTVKPNEYIFIPIQIHRQGRDRIVFPTHFRLVTDLIFTFFAVASFDSFASFTSAPVHTIEHVAFAFGSPI